LVTAKATLAKADASQADVERFNAVSDGVIVGSKIVKALHQGEPIQDFIKQAVAYQK